MQIYEIETSRNSIHFISKRISVSLMRFRHCHTFTVFMLQDQMPTEEEMDDITALF